MAKNCLILKNFEQPQKSGLYHRLLCLTGENKGVSYYLLGVRIVLGRSQKADIPVVDSKVSREHAELSKVAESYVITDLGSQNGVIINELKITQEKLINNDNIVIGSTVFKYSIIEVQSKMALSLDGKSENLPIGPDKSIKNKNDEGPEEDHTTDSENSNSKEKTKKKRIYMIVGVLVLLLLLIDDGEKTSKPSPKPLTTKPKFNSRRLRENSDEKEISENVKEALMRGLREDREGNYFRAINEFNLALFLDANNAQASFYLRRTTQKLDSEIESIFIRAQKLANALRYTAAANEYCSVVRMLQNTPNDERYKNAELNIKEIEKILGLDDGEIGCLE